MNTLAVLLALPGTCLAFLVVLAWIGSAGTLPGRRRRTRWLIEDLEDYANDPHDPRFTHIPARKEEL